MKWSAICRFAPTTSIPLASTANKSVCQSQNPPPRLAAVIVSGIVTVIRGEGIEPTMRKGIQYLGPKTLPAAAEMGWKITKVIKNRDTASLTSLLVAPMSFAKPRTGNSINIRDQSKYDTDGKTRVGCPDLGFWHCQCCLDRGH